jgi:hypothetical protein
MTKKERVILQAVQRHLECVQSVDARYASDEANCNNVLTALRMLNRVLNTGFRLSWNGHKTVIYTECKTHVYS